MRSSKLGKLFNLCICSPSLLALFGGGQDRSAVLLAHTSSLDQVGRGHQSNRELCGAKTELVQRGRSHRPAACLSERIAARLCAVNHMLH